MKVLIIKFFNLFIKSFIFSLIIVALRIGLIFAISKVVTSFSGESKDFFGERNLLFILEQSVVITLILMIVFVGRYFIQSKHKIDYSLKFEFELDGTIKNSISSYLKNMLFETSKNNDDYFKEFRYGLSKYIININIRQNDTRLIIKILEEPTLFGFSREGLPSNIRNQIFLKFKDSSEHQP